MELFTAKYGSKIAGSLSGFDRLIFWGTLRPLAYPAGLRSYLSWAGIHSRFGLMPMRLQSWFPFQLQVYLNGREWLARRSSRIGIQAVRELLCVAGECSPGGLTITV